MAEFNFNILEPGFRIELLTQTDTECASQFTYRVYAEDGEIILIDLTGNYISPTISVNGDDTSELISGSQYSFDTSIIISFSIQNSGVPGTFDSVEVELSNESTGDDATVTATRESDASRCESIEYTFDVLTDTPEDKDGQAGKFVKVSDDEISLEYVDIQGEVTFQSDLDPNLAMPNDVGGIKAGTTIQELNDLNLNLTKFIELQNFETMPAYIGTNAYTQISGQTTSTAEVGTNTTQSFTATLNKGSIYNGDDTYAGGVVGDINQLRVKDPDNVINFTSTNPPSNSVSVTMPIFVIGQGNNTWEVDIDNYVGTTIYKDNKSGTDPVAEIEAAKNDTTRDTVSFTRVGVYRRFHYIGTENGSPNDSSSIRSLTSAYLSTSNTGSWTVAIGAGSGSAEFSFYIPQGKAISVIDLGNLNLDITADFQTTNLQVNDANGDPVNYTKYTRFAGTLGYTNPTTFEITIS